MKSTREVYNENMERIDTILNKGGNPNHDKLGRFSRGSGGGKSGGKSKYKKSLKAVERRKKFGARSIGGIGVDKLQVKLDYMTEAQIEKDARKFFLTYRIDPQQRRGKRTATFIGYSETIDRLLKSYES